MRAVRENLGIRGFFKAGGPGKPRNPMFFQGGRSGKTSESEVFSNAGGPGKPRNPRFFSRRAVRENLV